MTPPVVHHGECPCGSVVIETYTEPIMVFTCHCTHCQAYTGKSFSSTSWFWKAAVSFSGDVTYTTTSVHGGLVGLDRGKCSKCNSPVIEIGRGLLKGSICPSASALNLQPTFNLFYNSGRKEGTMGLKTFYTDVSSNLFTVPILLFRGLPGLLYLSWLWTADYIQLKFGRKSDKNKKN